MVSAGRRTYCYGLFRVLITLFILTIANHSLAFSVIVSGATDSVQDATTASKLTITGAYAMPSVCTEKTGISTCNSCVGNRVDANNSATPPTVPAPCNEKSIYEELSLSISIESDKKDMNTLPIGASLESTYVAKSGFTASTVNGSSYSFTATWSQLATMLGIDFSCATETGCGGSKTFYFGPIKDEKFVEYVSVTINFSVINYTNKDTPLNGVTKAMAKMCKPATMDPLVSNYASTGLCFYEMYPGDEKAYITNLINGWKNTPVDPDTQLTYKNLVMFYAEKAAGATSLETLTSIQNNSPKETIGITTTEGDPLSSYKVSGLENGTVDAPRTYCFLPALQDATGSIIYFLDVQNLISGESFTDAQFDKLCASPSEVVGVLSDKDCFIATVAFGSRNHPMLDILREFRNKFLHPFSWGKSFIKYYYKNGPQWAKKISNYPLAKGLVKMALWPVIAIVYVILNPLWLALIFFIGLFVVLKVRAHRKANYKGSA